MEVDKITKNIIMSGNKYEEGRRYWKNQLKDEAQASSLYKECLHNTPDESYRSMERSFPGEISLKMGKMCGGSDYAAFIVLVSMLQYVLMRYTDKEDILVAMPLFKDDKPAGGFRLNMVLYIRTIINLEDTYKELLLRVKEIVAGARKHSNIPIDAILEVLGSNSTDELNKGILVSMMGLHESEGPEVQSFGILISLFRKDLNFGMEIKYKESFYTARAIEQFMSHFVNCLGMALCCPDTKLENLDIMTYEDRQLLISGFNSTDTQYQKEKTIHQLFEDIQESSRNKTALIFKGMDMTYDELNRRSNRLASFLRKKGVKADTVVGLMIRRSFSLITGMLGILKSGGAYLPLDPDYPKERNEYILEDSGADILLTEGNLTGKLKFSGRIIDIDDRQIGSESEQNMDSISEPRNLAYVIYTSGSTGNPKGVMIEHRAVINFIKGMSDRIPFHTESKILALTTVSFDIFVLETLLPLTMGLGIVLADERQQSDPRLLSELIAEYEVDMLQATPSRMQLLLGRNEGKACIKGLKVIMIGGEAFPQVLLDNLRELTCARIFNMYGPTETTVWSSVKELTGEEKITIGKPVSNTKIYILGKNDRLQPIGVPGELCIAGDGLARGYLKRPELNASRFSDSQAH